VAVPGGSRGTLQLACPPVTATLAHSTCVPFKKSTVPLAPAGSVTWTLKVTLWPWPGAAGEADRWALVAAGPITTVTAAASVVAPLASVAVSVKL